MWLRFGAGGSDGRLFRVADGLTTVDHISTEQMYNNTQPPYAAEVRTPAPLIMANLAPQN